MVTNSLVLQEVLDGWKRAQGIRRHPDFRQVASKVQRHAEHQLSESEMIELKIGLCAYLEWGLSSRGFQSDVPN